VTATMVGSPSVMANIAAGCVGQILQVHTPAGQFAGILDALVGDEVLRLRSGTNVYDVDLAQVVAIAHRAPDPGTVAAPAITWSKFDGGTCPSAPPRRRPLMVERALVRPAVGGEGSRRNSDMSRRHPESPGLSPRRNVRPHG